MSLIFLSHCSADNVRALALAQWLEGNGWADYFLDISESRGLDPGEQWQKALKDASHRCEAVVFLVSRAWLGSKWCLAEFLLAKQLGKKIFGVLIEDVPLGELPNELTSEWQLCDLVNGDTRVAFDVAREPYVPPGRVDLPEVGLEALKRGLQNAGLEATAFPWPPENESARAPYRGLKPYEAQDAAIFFGRDAAIVRGLDQVRQLRDNSNDNLLVILGSSGAGKSSFMRAGLWPRLKRDDHHFYPLPVVRPRGAAMNGEEGLVNSLAAALTDVGTTTIGRGEIRGRFRDDGSGDALMEYLQQLRDAIVARAVTDTPEPTFILPIDQGEELYATDGAEEAEQLRRQLSCLRKHDGDLVGEQGSPNLLAIVTVRTDLYEHLQTDELLQDVGRQIIDLTPMDRAEYKLIIEGPAQRATDAGNALVIEHTLTEQLLNDTHGADALPMLAFTLERLYTDYGADGDLTLEEYHLLGGVTGSLTAAIDAAMESSQSPPAIPADKVAQQRLLKEAFIPWLAEVDEQSGERRRRVADWDELPVEVHPMLERLTRARLLVRDLRSAADTDDKREVVEVAHEALLRRWPALVSWLDADQDSLKAIGAVSRAAQHWAQNNNNDEYLDHTGERLLDAEKLLNREDFKKRLQATGCAYLARCRAYDLEQTEKEIKQRQRLRRWFVAAVVLAIGASLAAGWAYESGQEATLAKVEAENNATKAKEAAQIASTAEAKAEAARTEAVQQAKDAEKQKEIAEAQRNLAVARRLATEARDILARRDILDFSDMSLVGSLATESLKRAHSVEGFKAWQTAMQHLPRAGKPLVHDAPVLALAFDRDGSRLATVSADNTARLWSVSNDDAAGPLYATSVPIESRRVNARRSAAVVEAPEEHDSVVSASSAGLVPTPLRCPGEENTKYFVGIERAVRIEENMVKVLNLFSCEEQSRIPHPGVRTVGVNLGNSHIATADVQGVKIWSLDTAKHLSQMHHAMVRALALSTDGSWLATAGQGDSVRIWDTTLSEKPVSSLTVAGVAALALSEDGTVLATADPRGVQIWEVASAKRLSEVKHPSVQALVLSSTGDRLATAGQSDTVRVWDTLSGNPVSEFTVPGVAALAFFPAGEALGVAAADGTVNVWDTTTGEVREDFLTAAADDLFDPDPGWSVTASDPESEELLMIGPERPAPCGGDGGKMRFVTAGGHLAAAVSDNGVTLFSLIDCRERVRIAHSNVHTIAMNSTVSHVATADNADVKVWDIATGKKLSQAPHARVRALALSANGERLATAGQDGSVQVWDTSSGKPLATFTVAGVTALALSDNGVLLATATANGTVKTWDAVNREMLSTIKHDEAVLAVAFSPDGKFIASASADKTARVWEIASDRERARINHEEAVLAVAFSQDGSHWATGSADRTVRVWDRAPLATEVRLYPVALKERISLGPVSSNADLSRMAVIVGETAQIWNPITNEELSRINLGLKAEVIALSPDDEALAAGAGGIVRVWDLASGEEMVRLDRPGDESLKALSFSAGGERLWISAGSMEQDESLVGMAFRWRTEDLLTASCSRLIRPMTTAQWQNYLGDLDYEPACRYALVTPRATDETYTSQTSSDLREERTIALESFAEQHDRRTMPRTGRLPFESDEFLALDVVGADLAVVRQRDLLELEEDLLHALRIIVGILEEQRKGGGGSSADVDQGKLFALAAQARYRRALRDLMNEEINRVLIYGKETVDDTIYLLDLEREFPASPEAALLLADTHPTAAPHLVDTRLIRAELAHAWRASQRTRALSEQAANLVPDALARRDRYRSQFEIAQRSLLEVSNAELTLTWARVQNLHTQSEHLLDRHRLLAAGGRLLRILDDSGRDARRLVQAAKRWHETRPARAALRERLRKSPEFLRLVKVAARLRVLQRRESVRLAEAMLQTNQAISGFIQERIEAGDSRLSDRRAAKQSYGLLDAAHQAAGARLVLAEADYQTIVGYAPGDLTQPEPVIVPASLEEALELARAHFVIEDDSIEYQLINAQVRQRWNDYTTLSELVELMVQKIELARSVRDAYRQQFDVAQRTLLDVLTVENSLHEEGKRLITAQVDLQLASAQLAAITGYLKQ